MYFCVDIGKEWMLCDVFLINENDENYWFNNINNIMLNYVIIFGIFIKEIINNYFYMDVLWLKLFYKVVLLCLVL